MPGPVEATRGLCSCYPDPGEHDEDCSVLIAEKRADNAVARLAAAVELLREVRDGWMTDDCWFGDTASKISAFLAAGGDP